MNFGCTPTKAVIASARVAHQARRASEYGLEIPELRIDFPAVLERAKEIVELKRGGLDKGLIRVVADASNGRILGATVLTAEGAEIVHMYVDLMNAGATLDVIQNAVHIHPTLAEDIQSAVS